MCGGETKVEKIKAYICEWGEILSALFIFISISLVLSFIFSCEEAGSKKFSDPIVEVDDRLFDTGLSFDEGDEIYIAPAQVGDTKLYGDEFYPYLPSFVPLFSFGGDNFIPAVYGTYYKVTRNDAGKNLILRANGKTKVKLIIDKVESDSPVLISPKQNSTFFGATPILSWSPDNRAQRYIVQLSKFPDFRELLYSLEIVSQSGTGGIISIPFLDLIFGGGQSRRVFLTEGVWYVRLMVQRNYGRPLAPDLRWSDFSPPYKFGIEWGSAPSALIEKPKDGEKIREGESIRFLILSPEDPSGNIVSVEERYSDCDEREKEVKVHGPYFMYDRFVDSIGVYKKFDYSIKVRRGKYLFAVHVKDSLDKIFELYSKVPLGNLVFEQGIPQELKIRFIINFDAIFGLRESKYYFSLDLCQEKDEGGNAVGEVRFLGSSLGDSIQQSFLSTCFLLFPEVSQRLVKLLASSFKDFPSDIPSVRFPILSFELTNPLDITQVVFDFSKGEVPEIEINVKDIVKDVGQALGYTLFIDNPSIKFNDFVLKIDIMDEKHPKIYFSLNGYMPDPKFFFSYIVKLVESSPELIPMLMDALSQCIPGPLNAIMERFIFGMGVGKK